MCRDAAIYGEAGGVNQAGPLADGYRLIVWALMGDQDYKRDCLGFPSVAGLRPCACCPSNAGSTPWYDFRPNAKWVKAIYTEPQWRATGLDKCQLFRLTGLTHLSVASDWMHDKHLGTDRVPLGLLLYMSLAHL